jgi:HAE1 family hydrophobic/amphiphilic exporter-1
MIRLVRFFVERYVFAFAIFLALVFFGISAGLRLGVDLLPDFEVPIVAVSTSYPGAGSEETAQQISTAIEDGLATLAGISGITSISGEGLSVVIAQFDFGVSVDQAAIDVKQRVDAIESSLPEDAGTPVIQKFDPSDEPILGIALVAPATDLLEAQRYAEDVLSPRLQRIDGVANVSVRGPLSREIQVLLEPAALERYGLTAQQVTSAIAATAITLPAGSMTLGDERILLSFRRDLETLQDVERALIDPVRGLRVQDVAVVRDASSTPNSFVRLNGEPAILLEVRKTSGANAVSTAANVRRALAGLELPPGYHTEITGDTSVFVANSVFDTFRETLLASAAVALIVLLFIGRLGSTFSVVLAIPITLTGAVIVLGLLGFTFNVVTLLAITVAVGLVVDDSIVISENVARYREMGHSLKEAVFKGASEVAVAVLTATLSLLAVFLPIAFLPGVVGQFFAQFGLSLAAATAVSYLEAMLFLTVRLAYMPNPLPPSWADVAARARQTPATLRALGGLVSKPAFWLLAALAGVGLLAWQQLEAPLPIPQPLGAEPHFTALMALGALAAGAALAWLAVAALRVPGKLLLLAVGALFRSAHMLTDRLMVRLRSGYERALARTLEHSGVVLVTAAVLVGSLAVIFPRISFNFVSPVDAGILSLRLELPPGTPLQRSDELAQRLETMLRQQPEVRIVRSTVGVSGTFGRNTPERANVTVELVPRAERESSFALAQRFEAELLALLSDAPEASLEVSSSDGGAVPVETGIELTLETTDLALLRARNDAALQRLRENPHLRNVRSSLEGSVSERVFVLNEAALIGTGLTMGEIAQTLRTYNVGTQAGTLRQGGTETPVVVKANPLYLRDEQALLSLPVYAQALQRHLPLAEFGRFEVQAVPLTINRSNQAYVATFSAELAPGSPGQFQVRSEVEAALAAAGILDDAVQLGTGVGPDLLGDLAFYGPIAFFLALALNYLVIASQFNSFRYPLYLLLTVPLALVGAFWLFYLTGSALDVISILGVVILIGLVTKNAILLLDVVMTQVERTSTLKEALVRAGRLRLRPILMTALTIVIISLPLLLGLGDGSEFRRPLGLVILGGVISSTFLTLFVVPAAFYRFERRRFEGDSEPEVEPKPPEEAPKPLPQPARTS